MIKCSVCNLGYLKEREDGLWQCARCLSCFRENGKAVDEVPRTPGEAESITNQIKRIREEEDIYPVPSPS